MKISWGNKIAILYISFVVMIVSLVAASSMKKVDLVSDDYYQKEVVFQQRLNAELATNTLKDSVTLAVLPATISLNFPNVFKSSAINASIHFYAVADGSADQTFSMVTGDAHLTISRAKLRAALYEVQISWKADGKEYYQAIPLNLR